MLSPRLTIHKGLIGDLNSQIAPHQYPFSRGYVYKVFVFVMYLYFMCQVLFLPSYYVLLPTY